MSCFFIAQSKRSMIENVFAPGIDNVIRNLITDDVVYTLLKKKKTVRNSI